MDLSNFKIPEGGSNVQCAYCGKSLRLDDAISKEVKDDFSGDSILKDFHKECFSKLNQNKLEEKHQNALKKANIQGKNLVSLSTRYDYTKLEETGQMNGVWRLKKKGDVLFLVFYGSHRTGKSLLACKMAEAFIKMNKKVLYKTVFWLKLELDDSLRPESKIGRKQYIQDLIKLDLFVLDEVGLTHQTDSEKALIANILLERYNQEKPTVVVSNFFEKDFVDYFPGALLARWKEETTVKIKFDWERMDNIKEV